ncbi:putative TIM-barrel fold metal-dependent hydrolase [Curtobacterium sp. PhB191]|uniref:amidohydrolase family protein n=1 Tax=Curtobacterium sp. PhB191 TaxID=2485202 RepID=UPI001046472D|nr:amidohydrolase family protein [Curtobacterium sp. PhB191]TCU81852.1 putative TIM-barrel fold metal-dependent hydrolase [Curtobacterium sp. PhB191]
MRHTFMPEDYLHATAGWDVIGTVHCEAERSRTEQVEESAWLTALHDTDPRFPMAAVGHVFFTQPDLDDVLAGHAEHAIVRGVRSKPVTSAHPGPTVRGVSGSMQDPAWIAGLHRLAAYDFSWDLRVPYHHLAEAADVVQDIPDTTVVINHCGLPLDRSDDGLAIWRHGMERLAALPNTVVKVSELGLPGNRWDRPSNEAVVRETLAVFGHDRSMFASNLPVATLTAPDFDEVMDTILSGAAGSTHDQLDALFHGTAARVYRIPLADTVG